MGHFKDLAISEMEHQAHLDSLQAYKQANNLTSTLAPEPTSDVQEKLTAKPINVGIVCQIKEISSKFGKSFQIVMEHGSFIFNCQTSEGAARMFKVGEKAAFSYKEKAGAGGKTYKIINDVYLTF